MRRGAAARLWPAPDRTTASGSPSASRRVRMSSNTRGCRRKGKRPRAFASSACEDRPPIGTAPHSDGVGRFDVARATGGRLAVAIGRHKSLEKGHRRRRFAPRSMPRRDRYRRTRQLRAKGDRSPRLRPGPEAAEKTRAPSGASLHRDRHRRRSPSGDPRPIRSVRLVAAAADRAPRKGRRNRSCRGLTERG